MSLFIICNCLVLTKAFLEIGNMREIAEGNAPDEGRKSVERKFFRKGKVNKLDSAFSF